MDSKEKVEQKMQGDTSSSGILTPAASRWSLRGATALVTGGTRGIGYAVVEDLARLGAAVHTCSRNEAELKERLKKWEELGLRVTGSVCDCSLPEQREELMRTAAATFGGKLNILLIVGFSVCLIKNEKEGCLTKKHTMIGHQGEQQPELRADGEGHVVQLEAIVGRNASSHGKG